LRRCSPADEGRLRVEKSRYRTRRKFPKRRFVNYVTEEPPFGEREEEMLQKKRKKRVEGLPKTKQ